jgi:drug/metabolite transporter (DMT)-like permease
LRSDFWWGALLIVLAALSWSTAGLFPRLVSTDMPTTLLWRSALGGLTVLVMYAVLQREAGVASLWRLTRAEIIMSFLGAAAMISFVAAFYFAPVADVVFIYGAFPVVTLLLSALLLKQPVRAWDMACSVVVALGVAIILGGQPSLKNVFGTLLSFCATVLFAVMTVGIKRYPQAQMVKVTYAGAALSALIMVPFSDFQHTSAHDMAWLWLYGFLNIGVGFGLYLLGVRKIKAVLASLICMLEIALAPLWAYVVFGDSVRSASLMGGTVIVLAVAANLLLSGNQGDTNAATH